MKRTRFTEEQIIGVLKEHEAGIPIADLCRKHGVSSASIYKWQAKYGGMDVSEVTGASDHGGSEAIYLCDPDGNGLELYWDRPQEDWPRTPDGALMLVNSPIDLDDLLNECEIANSA